MSKDPHPNAQHHCPSQRDTREYEAFLMRKVEAARANLPAGKDLSQADIEDMLKALRVSLAKPK